MNIRLQPKPLPWTDTTISGTAKIRRSTVGAKEKKWYETILQFLCDEGRVVAELKQLAANPNVATVDGFQKDLAAREKAAGFDAEVIRLDDLVEADFFMNHVRAK